MNGNKIKSILEELFPLSIAESWDNVGLQVGTLDKDITSIVVSLDLTKEVIQEAIDKNSNLIICHHPMIFKAIKTINTSTYLGQMIETLIQNNISLYIMHTNYDHSDYGMNVQLGTLLGLNNIEMLDPIDEQYGLGVIGEVNPIKVNDFISNIKNNFNLEAVKYVGDEEDTIRKIAIIGGSGASYIFKNLHKGFDLFITGDVSYHYALDAKNSNVNILDVGHYFESNGMRQLVGILKEKGIKIPVHFSTINTNPFKNL